MRAAASPVRNERVRVGRSVVLYLVAVCAFAACGTWTTGDGATSDAGEDGATDAADETTGSLDAETPDATLADVLEPPDAGDADAGLPIGYLCANQDAACAPGSYCQSDWWCAACGIAGEPCCPTHVCYGGATCFVFTTQPTETSYCVNTNAVNVRGGECPGQQTGPCAGGTYACMYSLVTDASVCPSCGGVGEPCCATADGDIWGGCDSGMPRRDENGFCHCFFPGSPP